MIAALIILIRLLLLAVVFYAIVYVYRMVRSSMNTFKMNNPFRASETCPVCNRPIQVSGDDMACPHCGVKLGRTPDGKLIVRVN